MKINVFGFGDELMGSMGRYAAISEEIVDNVDYGHGLVEAVNEVKDNCGFKADVLEKAYQYIKEGVDYSQCRSLSDVCGLNGATQSKRFLDVAMVNRDAVLQGFKVMKDICEQDQSKCAQCPVQDICMEIKAEMVPSEMELPLE